jgi:long-chain fatty acid transport protein
MNGWTLKTLLPVFAGLALTSGTGWAAGFALQNQNGSGNGNAFAGAAAAADDAGTIFFNPAGMALLPQGSNLALAGTYLERKVEFTDAGTAPPTLSTTSSTNGGDAGGASLIPAFYYARSLSRDLTLGLGISPTFGNKTEYTTDFFGRFSGYFAELKVINLNPSVAYKLSERFSIGLGLSRGDAEIEFRQRAPGALFGIGGGQEADIDVSGEDDAWGWNIGTIYQPTDSTRLGFAYRSTVKYDVEGRMVVRNAATGAALFSTPVAARLETPDSASIAVFQQLDNRWEMLGDLTWTGWSSVQTLRAVSTDGTCPGALPPPNCATLAFNFKDTMRIGLGANYHYSPQWKLRFGVAWDESPVRSDADRTMTLPDSDRTWIAFGARYRLSPGASIDVGYAHIFFKDAATAREVRNPISNGLVQTVRGTFDTSADLLSFQYNAHF